MSVTDNATSRGRGVAALGFTRALGQALQTTRDKWPGRQVGAPMNTKSTKGLGCKLPLKEDTDDGNSR